MHFENGEMVSLKKIIKIGTTCTHMGNHNKQNTQ